MYMTIMSANRRHVACTNRYAQLKKEEQPKNQTSLGIEYMIGSQSPNQ